MVLPVIHPGEYMFVRITRALSAAALVAAALAGCSGAKPSLPGSSARYESLSQVSTEVTSALGYSPEVIELLAGSAHLRALVKDTRLASLNQADREIAAGRIVAAIELALVSRQELSGIQEITIAIIHLSQPEKLGDYSHVEDVLEYRKSANGHFVSHVS